MGSTQDATVGAMKSILQWLSACLALVSMAAQSGHQVEVLDTWPAGEAVTVGPGEPFHLRIAWSTDSMTRIFARPYYRGKEVPALNSPSPSYRGSGETSVWFTLSKRNGQVDEVRLFTGNGGKVTRRPPTLTHRVSISGSTTALSATPAPEWVARLQADVESATGGPQEPTGSADDAWMRGFMLLVLALTLCGFLLPIWCVWRWRGRWRIAAAIPLLGMGLLVLMLLSAAVFAPGSLGLFPLTLLLAAICSSLVTMLLVVARWLSLPRVEPPASSR